MEKAIPEDKKGDVKPGAAVVETGKGEQEVDFKTLTAEEAFQVLGVRPPSPPPTMIPRKITTGPPVLLVCRAPPSCSLYTWIRTQGCMHGTDDGQSTRAAVMSLCSQTQVTHEGLTSAEVQKRLAEYGPNKLPEGSRNPILVYLGEHH